MTFGEKLRELRESKGMTREELAAASGVPFGTIHGYEIGRRAPSLASTLALAKSLGVDCTAFANCEDLAGGEVKQPDADQKKGKDKKGKGKK